MKFVKSTRIVTENGIINGYLGLEDGRIACIGEGTIGQPCEDFQDYRILPGIIDTHVHGTMGYGLFEHDNLSRQQLKAEIQGYLKAQTIHGVTALFPTGKPGVFDLIDQIVTEGYTGARVMGIHSEGPWQNRVGENGRPRPYPPVSREAAQAIVAECGGRLKLMGLAPEIPGIDVVIDYLKEQQIVMSFCHSEMKYQDAIAAIAKGISVATHVGNVMTGLHHRDVGGTGAMILSDAVDCEVICDGLHLANEYLRILFKVKDPSRFMMISDSNYIAGAKPGRYINSRGLETIIDERGINRDIDGRISGSTKPVLYGIGNLVENLHMPLETVVNMASLNPARKYGFADRKGSLAVGKDADLVVINDQYQAVATFVEGVKVHSLEAPIIGYNPFIMEKFKMP